MNCTRSKKFDGRGVRKVFEKQNEEEFIELLFLQRNHYALAGNLNRALWVMALAITILGSNSIIVLNKTVQIWFIAGLYIVAWIVFLLLNRSIKIGAYAKEFFDRSLFGLPLNSSSWEIKSDEIREFAYKLKQKKHQKFIVAYNNRGTDEPRGLRDWYTEIPSSNHNQTILNCQNENIWWDKHISDKFRIVLLAVALVVFLSLCIINYNRSLLEIVISILSNIALVLKLMDDLIVHKKFNDHQIKMKTALEFIRKKPKPSKQDIESVQEQILLRRQMRYLPFDFLHKLNRKELHRVWINRNVNKS